MISTKDQEREALEKIKEIVAGLGENSYVATALAGCFEIAEQNIEYDAADSLKERLEIAEKQAEEFKRAGEYYAAEEEKLRAELEQAKNENKSLKEELDKELEWKDCPNMGTQMSQTDYERLRESGEKLTESQAKELIAEEFGFDPEKITIITSVNTYESNKHWRTRVKETYVRAPVNCSTDWNYIRFNCSNWFYEMIDGQLHQYYC